MTPVNNFLQDLAKTNPPQKIITKNLFDANSFSNPQTILEVWSKVIMILFGL